MDNREQSNEAFVPDEDPIPNPTEGGHLDIEKHSEEKDNTNQRGTWSKPIESLLSAIAMSVGLGNIWRFPFVAYENGGGAFLIPYLVVLILIGKPLYFLDTILGQFSSYGSVKVWAVAPIAKGVGYATALATWLVVTYYCSLIALTVFYIASSFQAVLPWNICDPQWADDNCYNSSGSGNFTGDSVGSSNFTADFVGRSSSAEQFFKNSVLKQLTNIDDGIGIPDWRLTLCLMFSWIVITIILIKGVASSGKVAYFTAIFPYVGLISLLIRGLTLDGAVDGILFFITPQWDKILKPEVWFAAVTQCFFSLSVGFGPVIMNASYNGFRHKLYRDATIVTALDTFTSLLAGITIFSILGNLARESGRPIESVVQGGTGLAFISYPEAISKFDLPVVPQLFSILFFFMLFTLGVGSAVSLCGCVVTIVCDAFPNWKQWLVTLVICCIGFLIGLVYVTPGGMYVLDVVDYFGGGFIVFILVLIETIAVCWIYGLKNFLHDVEFMLGKQLGIYWKFTWGIFIPLSMTAILIYSLTTVKTFEIKGYVYPSSLTGTGWALAGLALFQVPLWAGIVMYKSEGSLLTRLKASMIASDRWGPKNLQTRAEWIAFKEEKSSPCQPMS